MKITIGNDKTLKDLEIDLTPNFIIFAGENNSGKTQLVEEISKELESREINVITISAEKVILDNEIATGAKDKFKENLTKLIDLSISSKGLNVKNKIDDIETELPNIFNEYGVDNIELSVKKGKPKDDDYIKACKDLYIKKALDSITIRDTLKNTEGISLEDAGQGVERLAIVSLIRYISQKLNKPEGDSYLIIEEPEIYLHPKLKKSFNSALRKLSEGGIKVIITTHDPFFIQLGCDKNDLRIYNVFRNIEKESFTDLELIDSSKLLKYNSYAEINWKIFKLDTSEYFIQLYETLKEEHSCSYLEFDKSFLLGKHSVPQTCKDDNGKDITFLTRMRHDYAHNKDSKIKETLKEGIEKLIEIHAKEQKK